MRVQELREQVTSPTRLTPFQDELAWGELVDRLIAGVREEERRKAATTLERLATSALALASVDAVSRLISGVADRDYAVIDAPPSPTVTQP